MTALRGQLVEFKSSLAVVPLPQLPKSAPAPEAQISGMASSVEELQSALGAAPRARPAGSDCRGGAGCPPSRVKA